MEIDRRPRRGRGGSRGPRPVVPLALAVAVAVAGGPGAAGQGAAWPPDDDWALERLRREVEVEAGTPVTVSNPWGDVRFRLLEDDVVDVSAVVQRRRGDPETATLELRETDGALSVEVDFPPSGDPRAAEYEGLERRRRVDLVVFVPPGSPVTARTDDALLEGKGLAGDVDFATVSGDIVISTTGSVRAASERGHVYAVLRRGDWDRPPRFETTTGDVRLELARAVEATVRLTTRGEITTDYSIEIERPGGGLLKRAVARIGEGDRAIEIVSEMGNVKLLAAPF